MLFWDLFSLLIGPEEQKVLGLEMASYIPYCTLRPSGRPVDIDLKSYGIKPTCSVTMPGKAKLVDNIFRPYSKQDSFKYITFGPHLEFHDAVSGD